MGERVAIRVDFNAHVGEGREEMRLWLGKGNGYCESIFYGREEEQSDLFEWRDAHG